MAALPSDRVYQGFWIDYSRGTVIGATITTTANTANLIIAITSLLVAFTGAHLWELVAFVHHSRISSRDPQPTLHRQRQFLVRNIVSPGAFVLEMIKVGWGWRRHHPWASLFFMALVALICSVGFLTAGIFVSLLVSNSGIQVLAKSASCGFVSWQNESTPLHRSYQQQALKQAINYAEECYNKTGELPQCNIYAQPNITIQHVSEADCPFPGLCTGHTALRLDTGLMDSKEVFGINMPSNLRVQMQRAITCAPIDDARFFTTRPSPPDILKKYNNRDPLPGELLYEWSLGSLSGSSRPYNSTFWGSNYTSTFSKIYALT